MIHSRVAQESVRLRDGAEFEGDYIIAPARSKWRIYKDGTEYSQTSGQVIKLGKVVRDALGLAPLDFDTKAEAVEYARELSRNSPRHEHDWLAPEAGETGACRCGARVWLQSGFTDEQVEQLYTYYRGAR